MVGGLPYIFRCEIFPARNYIVGLSSQTKFFLSGFVEVSYLFISSQKCFSPVQIHLLRSRKHFRGTTIAMFYGTLYRNLGLLTAIKIENHSFRSCFLLAIYLHVFDFNSLGHIPVRDL